MGLLIPCHRRGIFFWRLIGQQDKLPYWFSTILPLELFQGLGFIMRFGDNAV